MYLCLCVILCAIFHVSFTQSYGNFFLFIDNKDCVLCIVYLGLQAATVLPDGVARLHDITHKAILQAYKHIPLHGWSNWLTAIYKRTVWIINVVLIFQSTTNRLNYYFWGNPLRQATKRHLNNSWTVKNDDKWEDLSSVWLSCCSVLGRLSPPPKIFFRLFLKRIIWSVNHEVTGYYLEMYVCVCENYPFLLSFLVGGGEGMV